jgi:hypothetical protein
MGANDLSITRLAFHHDRGIRAAPCEADAFGTKTNVDSLCLENVPHSRGHILVLAVDKTRSLLDDGHLAAEAAVHLRKLEADVTAADDDEVMRQDIEIQQGFVG